MMNVVAALFAVDPSGLGGVALRAAAGKQRDEWLALLRRLLPATAPMRRVPLNINDAALLGGLDLGATLNAGRPVAQLGLLASADGGVVVLAMAERVSKGTAARLSVVLDTQEVSIERDSLTLKRPARLGMVALDEGIEADEQVAASLVDRFAFLVQLQPASEDDTGIWESADIAQARLLLPKVRAGDDVVEALCIAALALGIGSLRTPLLAVKAARCAAALDGELQVSAEHTALAARLVLAPRATRVPEAAEAESSDAPEPSQDDRPDDRLDASDPNESTPPSPKESPQDQALKNEKSDDQTPESEPDVSPGQALTDRVVQAARAAIPQGLLAALKVGEAAKAKAQAAAGRSGASQKSQTRGRPLGARRGEPRAGARLNVLETLRAAAPWQKLRKRQLAAPTQTRRIHVRREDFHVTRFKQLGQTTTLFVVDASGSSALNRLAEAKGAVELLLADCYVRRDRVAVLAFRGTAAELLLPPTRSLARAKRSLAGLPGGGGTPLATAIDAARELANQIKRKGETPIVVMLTDGRGNIARDGLPGRHRANDDAVAAARQLRLAGVTALLLDTSPQPQAAAQLLAVEMGAAYLPLPYAGAQALSRAVQLATTSSR